MLDRIRKNIDTHITTFCRRLEKDYALSAANATLANSLTEFCLRKGKRIRPALMVLSYQGYLSKTKRPTPTIYHVATAIECLHNFFLIHDDIIDRAPLRRGKPTMHRLLAGAIQDHPRSPSLGQDLAIIAGDILFIAAIDEFLRVEEEPTRKRTSLSYFLETATVTALGECIDILQGAEPISRIKEADVFLNYSMKTARYTFTSPLVIGALLAGAPTREIATLSRLGLIVGQAFQIQDDLIGMYDTEEHIGKSVLSDLDESKKTLLIYHAYTHLSAKKRKIFTAHFMREKKTPADLHVLRELCTESGSLDYCLDAITNRLHQAHPLLKKLALGPTQKKIITGIIEQTFSPSEQIANKFSDAT